MADHGHPVGAHNDELLRAHFAAAERRETWPQAMAGYDEDVVLVAGEGAGPGHGVFHGRAAVGRWFADWLTMFEHVVFDIEIVHGCDALAVHARHSARGRESGIDLAADLYYAYWFRAGRVIRAEVYREREPAWRAAGVAG